MHSRGLLLLALAFPLFAFAQEDTDAQILRLLQEQTEALSDLRQELEGVKQELTEVQGAQSAPDASSAPTGAQADPAGAEATSEAQEAPKTTRKEGFRATVHTAESGNIGGRLGRLTVEGFPMSHDVGRSVAGVGNREIAYKGVGLLKIEEEGAHSLAVSFGYKERGTKCSVKLLVGNQVIFDERNFRRDTAFSSDIELAEGFYDFEIEQYCSRPEALWSLTILPPSYDTPIPLSGARLYHLARK